MKDWNKLVCVYKEEIVAMLMSLNEGKALKMFYRGIKKKRVFSLKQDLLLKVQSIAFFFFLAKAMYFPFSRCL